MQCIYFLVLVITFCFATTYFKVILKIFLKKYGKFLKLPHYKGIDSVTCVYIYMKSVSDFIFLTDFTLTIAFIVIYYLPKSEIYLHFPSFIETLISTGLYVPILFVVCSYTLKKFFDIYSIEKGLNFFSKSDIEYTILIISIYLDICLIFFDTNMGLFVASIILGKYIWIDFIFNSKEIKDVIRNILIPAIKQHQVELLNKKLFMTYFSIPYVGLSLFLFLLFKFIIINNNLSFIENFKNMIYTCFIMIILLVFLEPMRMRWITLKNVHRTPPLKNKKLNKKH